MKFDRRFRDQGLTVVGLHDPVKGEKEVAALGSSIEKFGLEFPVLVADEAVQEAYGIKGIPTRVLVDRQGRVVLREVGFSEDMAPEIERRILEATKQP